MMKLRPFFALALLAVAFFVSPAQAATTTVSFILVNDIYLMDAVQDADGKRRGGFPRLAAIVKAERAKGGHVILAHAGDTLSPSLMSGFDRGAHIITLTNVVQPDIFVPGNHEFDFGKATFLQRMGEAKFPLYGANLRGPDGQPLPNFKDRSIIDLDGVRIGLTGTTFDGAPLTSTPEDLRFTSTVDTTRQQAETLRREGADFVVAVSHASREQDFAIKATRAADLILSGHDHDLLVNFDGLTGLVESTYDAHMVTIIDATIQVKESNGRREMTWWPQFRIIDTATVTPDPEVAALVDGFQQEFTKEMDVPLGTTQYELDSRNAVVRTREAAIGNLMADAMRQSLRADIAIMNGGGIRSGVIYPAGAKLTRKDVLAELPFDNRVVTVEMSGADVRKAIENGLSLLPNAAGRFPQVSGITVVADPTRPAGQRVLSIKVGDAPLDDAKVYKVATNDFIARGGDGYTMFRDAVRLLPDPDSPLLANEVMVYIRNQGTVRDRVEGRIVFK